MPEMIASMERQRAKWAEYCATVRPQFDELPAEKACPHHPSEMRQKLFEETCQKSRQAGEFKPAWAPCAECQGAEAAAKRRAFWSKRGVPARVIEATFANFTADTEARADARGAVQAWIKRNGVFLLLRGTPGTGKGHLASGCLKAHGNGVFITHADMMTDLRASYTLHTTKGLIADWQEADCLVIDDFGLAATGADEAPMLYQVLATRYEERRPTVITTNLDREAFRAAIGERILDRMGEDCATVDLLWESWRTKK
jgi:DNA replication protein DnaC